MAEPSPSKLARNNQPSYCGGLPNVWPLLAKQGRKVSLVWLVRAPRSQVPTVRSRGCTRRKGDHGRLRPAQEFAGFGQRRKRYLALGSGRSKPVPERRTMSGAPPPSNLRLRPPLANRMWWRPSDFGGRRITGVLLADREKWCDPMRDGGVACGKSGRQRRGGRVAWSLVAPVLYSTGGERRPQGR
jgi:hypothetical protein